MRVRGLWSLLLGAMSLALASMALWDILSSLARPSVPPLSALVVLLVFVIGGLACLAAAWDGLTGVPTVRPRRRVPPEPEG